MLTLAEEKRTEVATTPSRVPFLRTLHHFSIKAALRSLLRDQSVRSALFSFTLTRTLIFFVVILTAQLSFISPPESSGMNAAFLSLHRIPVARIIRQRASIADANWYMNIAAGGYAHRPFATDQSYNWAFFPLFPLTLRLASKLTGERAITGMFLSSIFFFGALVLLHKTTMEFGFDPGEASRATLYVAAFPMSYFFSLPLTESLFLLLTVGSFYAAKREYWWTAGVVGALASATRVTGILLLPALVLLYWQTYRSLRPRTNLLALLLIPSGLLSFMWFLYSITGNPLAFKDIVVVWGRQPRFFLLPLLDYLMDPLQLARPWDFRVFNFAAAVTVIICGLVLLKRRQWALAFYTLAAMVVTLNSGLLQSQARYSMVVFPAFMVLGLAGRKPRFHHVLVTTSLILLTVFTICFCKNVDFVFS